MFFLIKTNIFIHFGYLYSASLSSPLGLLRNAPDYIIDTLSELPQATVSEGPAQGPYVAARVGFKPETLRTQGTELTTEPLRPTHTYICALSEKEDTHNFIEG